MKIFKTIDYRHVISNVICLLLVSMWTYVVLSKWSDGDLFRTQLGRQPIPYAWVPILFYVLPGVELLLAFLIAHHRTRRRGLWVSLFMMLGFTIYVILALNNHIWEHRPCACGGILNRMGWRTHLWFNLIVCLLNGLAIYLQKNHQTRKESGESFPSGLAGQKAS